MLGASKKKPEVDLAVVLGGGSKGKGGAKPLVPDEDPEGSGDEGSDEDALPPGFSEAGEEFLDDSRPMPERLAALHRAIKACTESY